MNATNIICANVARHTVDGYCAFHMVASAHERTIRELCDRLNELMGVGVQPASGCHHAELIFGATSVLVEFEGEAEERATWDDPGYPATVAILRVLIGGVWCDAEDVVPDAVLERWETELLEGCDEDRLRAADDAAEARAEARRERAEALA